MQEIAILKRSTARKIFASGGRSWPGSITLLVSGINLYSLSTFN